MDIKIIYKNDDFIALDKPAGLLVHSVKKIRTKNNGFAAEGRPKEMTLVDWALNHFPEIKEVGDDKDLRPGIVHRLDKETSGVILVARNQNYFSYLKNLFQNQQIKKTYLALVFGEVVPKAGIIEKPIALKTGSIKRTIWKGKMEKKAVTEYRVLKSIRSAFSRKYKASNIKEEAFSLIEATPKTGRTHQIRIHFSSVGHPIVGDKLYGFKKHFFPFDLNRLFLHAKSLEFSLVKGQRIKIEAELPKELKDLLKNLQNT